MRKTDVCIIGSGPAGATLSHFLSKEGINHVLIDKAGFPRDKICGDGITIDVLNVLKRINPDLQKKFTEQKGMLPSWGFCFRAPNGKELRYDFREDGFKYAPFYTAKRISLDSFLVENLPKMGTGEYLYNTELKALVKKDKSIQLQLKDKEKEFQLETKIVIGAEGEKPIVSKLLGLKHYRVKEHLIAALRIYHKNVQGFHEGNHLEFFFDRKLLPGYFWAFPLANNEANVGLGMVSTAIAKKKVNLKKLLATLVETNPHIKAIMLNAQAMENQKGWGLPTIAKARQIAGESYALIGDAGGMIEPFTGKGIGPGMMSARICSEHIIEALESKNYNLTDYQKHMYLYYQSEMKAGYALQKTLKYAPALNTVIGVSNLGFAKSWSHNKMVKEWNRWI